jgi:hypothetical protein
VAARRASVTLDRLAGLSRRPESIKIARRATFRFISDPAAQVAALLAGDVDVFARVTPRSVARSSRACPRLPSGGERLARQDHSGHQQRTASP